jgi:hypothetical protein
MELKDQHWSTCPMLQPVNGPDKIWRLVSRGFGLGQLLGD